MSSIQFPPKSVLMVFIVVIASRQLPENNKRWITSSLSLTIGQHRYLPAVSLFLDPSVFAEGVPLCAMPTIPF